MLTTEFTEAIYKESADNLRIMSYIAKICYLASGLVSAPVFFLFKKFLIYNFWNEWFTSILAEGGSPDPKTGAHALAISITLLLAFALSKWVAEKIVIPFAGETLSNTFRVEAKYDISKSEIPIIDQIINRATKEFYLVKISLDETYPKRWHYQYNWYLSYLLMGVSFVVLVGGISWLVS